MDEPAGATGSDAVPLAGPDQSRNGLSVEAEPPAEAERDLVERARRRDEGAFEMLVNRHGDRAYRLALRITRSPEDARDVAQEAFVRAWLALPAFRGDSAFGTWLHRIVVRKALDRAAALGARRRHETAPADGPEPAAPGVERDAALVLRLDRLMAGLDPSRKAALALYYVENRSVKEIAEILGRPENTVKTHLRRARAELRAAWERGEGRR